MANYPSTLPSFTNPTSTDYLTAPAHATQHSNENDEIVAIATELGTLAKGAYPTVRDRFEAIESSLASKIGSIAGAALNFVRYNATSDGIEASGYVYADFVPAAHTSSGDHDGRYYTETETNTLLDGKINTIIGDVTKFVGFTGTGQLSNSGYGASDFDPAGTSAAGIAAHLATHTSSVEHNPYVVGSKEVDESLIADGKVLYFNFENNQIQYATIDELQQEEVEDWVAAMFQNSTGLTWTYDDVAGTLTGDIDANALVAGTANQVIVTDDLDGTITLSTPQDLATNSSVQFGSLNINGAFTLPTVDGTNGYVMTTNGAGVITWQAASAAADVQNSPIRHFPYLLGGM